MTEQQAAAAWMDAVDAPSSVLRTVADLWAGSSAAEFGISEERFADIVLGAGRRCNFGQPAAVVVEATQQARFLNDLRCEDLVLARACATGNAVAWERFLTLYRETLYQAAYSITRSDTTGRELADSLYGDLYGMREKDGQRQSPLESYQGRGSLAAWLRSVLAQRYVDHYRSRRRETSLEDEAEPIAAAYAPDEVTGNADRDSALLRDGVREALQHLNEEERFLLAAYYLDGRTVRELGVVLHTHASTVSRKLGRIAEELRKQVMQSLRRSGLDRRQAEEAMMLDVRDLELPVQMILQQKAEGPFLQRESVALKGGQDAERN